MTIPSKEATDKDCRYVRWSYEQMLEGLKQCGYNSFEDLRNVSLTAFNAATDSMMCVTMRTEIMRYTRTKLKFRITDIPKLRNVIDNLRIARRNSKINQKAAAKTLNISVATLVRYENGVEQPNIEVLISMAKLYKVSINYLVGIEDYNSITETEPKLSKSEQQILKLYNSISNESKEKAIKLLKSLAKSEKTII